MKQILLILMLIFFTNCKNEKDKNIVIKVQDSLSSHTLERKIPNEIKTYIDSNNDFEMLEEKDLKLLKEQLQSSINTYIKGDFNQNNIEDFAIILRYKGYKNKNYTNYNFPFLIVFNDYKNGINPNIVYKTGDYENDDIKTVIYDQFEEGIFSYLKKGNVCNKEVINIVLPEKSSFFVYWNPNKSLYEFLNYLDEDLCKKVSNTDIKSNNNDLIRIDKASLFVYQKEFKNLIFNESSLSTNIEIKDDKLFNLTYEYNASSVKQKCTYNFIYNNNVIYLTSKEILKYSKDGILSNKIYLKNYILNNQNYDELEDIGSSIDETFSKDNSLANTNLFDSFNKKIGVLKFSITNKEKFINTSSNEDKYLIGIEIIKINEFNDVAYFLEQTGVYNESIRILTEILKKDPQRIVAYLNIADAYWGNNQFSDAKKHYKKYLALMKSQNKDLNKVPKRVYERIK